jgi:hypothetical protein
MLGDFQKMKVGHRTWILADARCPAGYQCRCPTFCRKPDSGALHHSAKSGEEINLELAVFEFCCLSITSESAVIPARKSTHLV